MIFIRKKFRSYFSGKLIIVLIIFLLVSIFLITSRVLEEKSLTPPDKEFSFALSTCRSDLNQDLVVDARDITLLLTNAIRSVSNLELDINQDGKINSVDFWYLLADFNQSCLSSPSPNVSPTPTPISSPSPSPSPLSSYRFFDTSSPFNQLIPGNAIYTLESRIGSFRQVYQDWSMPIYRLGINENPPLVTVTNEYSGRQVFWPVPTYAIPASEADHNLGVVSKDKTLIYEMWNARWQGTSNILAGGMNSFPLIGTSATGISNPTNYRVTASGFAVSAGMVVREDFIDPTTGQLNIQMQINHALTMAIPYQILARGEFVPPAVGGEDASDAVGDIPLGARYALPKNLNIDSLNIHPLTKALIKAARDYGIFVNDRNAAATYNNKYVGTIRIEQGLINVLFGTTNDELIPTVQSEIYSVVNQYGLFRVTTP